MEEEHNSIFGRHGPKNLCIERNMSFNDSEKSRVILSNDKESDTSLVTSI